MCVHVNCKMHLTVRLQFKSECEKKTHSCYVKLHKRVRCDTVCTTVFVAPAGDESRLLVIVPCKAPV